MARPPEHDPGPAPGPAAAGSRAGLAALATLAALAGEIVDCRRCPRLVAWREAAAANPPARFAGERYWARPLPGFGDPEARVLVVGLAPAANGGNRTGRLFTGDRSGDFLFDSLHRTGFANQPTSVSIDDGLALTGLYLAAVVRCAPPDNKPLPDERATCLPYLVREIQLLGETRVIVALGAFAWDGVIRGLRELGLEVAPRPAFGHLAEASIGRYTLLGSYHPSQQNTFTGRLTPPMLDAVMDRARRLAFGDS
jgi:uracil-DNA glycosylase